MARRRRRHGRTPFEWRASLMLKFEPFCNLIWPNSRSKDEQPWVSVSKPICFSNSSTVDGTSRSHLKKGFEKSLRDWSLETSQPGITLDLNKTGNQRWIYPSGQVSDVKYRETLNKIRYPRVNRAYTEEHVQRKIPIEWRKFTLTHNST